MSEKKFQLFLEQMDACGKYTCKNIKDGYAFVRIDNPKIEYHVYLLDRWSDGLKRLSIHKWCGWDCKANSYIKDYKGLRAVIALLTA